jgi:N-acetylneuraminate synthase
MMGDSVTIIAEAGVNHNGEISVARQLINQASEAGADYVKFQTFRADKLVSKFAEKAAYQKKGTGDRENQLQMLEKLELGIPELKKLIKYAERKGIGVLSSPFDADSVNQLVDIGIPIIKIPSGEITDLPYLRSVGNTKVPVILSTGMAELAEVERALKILIESGTEKKSIIVLHCHTDYPTSFCDVNLKAMNTIKKELNVNIGYSDHTLGTEIPVAAAALGAKVIEKHFTLDRTMEGPDHKSSLEQDELLKMVQSIRNVELALGDGIKRPTKSELKNRDVVRKSIHYKRDLRKGDAVDNEDMIMLRPGDGISPMELDQIIGNKLARDVHSGQKANRSDFV